METDKNKYWVLYNIVDEMHQIEHVDDYDNIRKILYGKGYRKVFDHPISLDDYEAMIRKLDRRKKWIRNLTLTMEDANPYGDYKTTFATSAKLNGQPINDFEVIGHYGRLLIDLANRMYRESPQSKIDHENWKKQQRAKKETFVYLMLDENTGYYKIGRSKEPKVRERTLQSEKPTVVMLHHYAAKATEEKRLHKKYADKRIRGEWFALTEEDVNYIKSL